MSAWKRFFIIYCVLFATTKTILHFTKWNAVGYHRAHLLRFAQVVDINFFMLLGTVFAWARINALFDPASVAATTVGDAKKRSSNDLRLSTLSTDMKRAKILTNVIFWIFAFCNHVAYFLYYFVNDVEPNWISWICLCCVGFYTHLIVFLVGFSLFNFVLRLVQSSQRGREILKPIFRLQFIKTICTDAKRQTLTALVLSTLLSALSLYAAARPVIRNVDVKINGLPDSFDGFKIALLTDLHVGPTVGRTAVERVVNLTNAASPDIVAIAGDLVDGTMEDLSDAVKPLQNLKSTYGVYFSTGNHEMYYGRVDDWLAFLNSLNVVVLHNENRKISVDKSSYVCLAGVDDIYTNYLGLDGHKMDVEKALNSCDSKFPTILLAHNPKAAKLATESNRRIDLILSGHTHAGQMYVLVPLMYMVSPYFYGLHRHFAGYTQIYVTSGVHYWGAPMKMLGFSEIAIVTLRR